MNNSYRTTCAIKDNGDGKPKKWSLIKYTIVYNMPLSFSGGSTSVEITNVQAVVQWPDDPVDIQPAAVGSSHPLVVTEGFMEAFIAEFPAMAECPSKPPPGQLQRGPGGRLVIPTGGTGGNTSGNQGGQGSSGSGDSGVGVPP